MARAMVGCEQTEMKAGRTCGNCVRLAPHDPAKALERSPPQLLCLSLQRPVPVPERPAILLQLPLSRHEPVPQALQLPQGAVALLGSRGELPPDLHACSAVFAREPLCP